MDLDVINEYAWRIQKFSASL